MNEKEARGHDQNGQYWRDRAEECRTKAEQMHNPEGREALLQLARSYEGMAKRAHGRADRDRGQD